MEATEEIQNLKQKLSLQMQKCNTLEVQQNTLMETLNIPPKQRNFLSLRQGLENLKNDYVNEKDRADNLALQMVPTEDIENLRGKFSIQKEKCNTLEVQQNILMDILDIPTEERNFLSLREGLENLKKDYINEKERADNLACHMPIPPSHSQDSPIPIAKISEQDHPNPKVDPPPTFEQIGNLIHATPNLKRSCDFHLETILPAARYNNSETIPVRDIANRQKNLLSDIFYERNRPTWDRDNLDRVYIIPRKFIFEWRNFIRNPYSQEVIKMIPNEIMLCSHGGLMYPLDPLDYESGLYYVSEEEWSMLKDNFTIDQEICVIRMQGTTGFNSIFSFEPPVCDECLAQRFDQGYPNVTVYVQKLTGAELPPEREFTVSPYMLLRDFKVKIMEAFKVAPFDQKLCLNGLYLTDSSQTLGQLGVLSKSQIYLYADEPNPGASVMEQKRFLQPIKTKNARDYEAWKQGTLTPSLR